RGGPPRGSPHGLVWRPPSAAWHPGGGRSSGYAHRIRLTMSQREAVTKAKATGYGRTERPEKNVAIIGCRGRGPPRRRSWPPQHRAHLATRPSHPSGPPTPASPPSWFATATISAVGEAYSCRCPSPASPHGFVPHQR